MPSLIQLFFPKFHPPATVENAGSESVLAPDVTDPEAYDAKVRELLKAGAEVRAAAH